jgi:hypothetical protein
LNGSRCPAYIRLATQKPVKKPVDFNPRKYANHMSQVISVPGAYSVNVRTVSSNAALQQRLLVDRKIQDQDPPHHWVRVGTYNGVGNNFTFTPVHHDSEYQFTGEYLDNNWAESRERVTQSGDTTTIHYDDLPDGEGDNNFTDFVVTVTLLPPSA